MFCKMKKILSLVLLMVMVNNISINSYALNANVDPLDGKVIYKDLVVYNEQQQPLSLDYVSFSEASIIVGKCDQGMEVVITTSLADKAARIGVKDIEVKRKVLLGWKHEITVRDAEVNDATGFSYSFIYTSAKQGETYKVICTHYGEDEDGYREMYHDSGEITYNF